MTESCENTNKEFVQEIASVLQWEKRPYGLVTAWRRRAHARFRPWGIILYLIDDDDGHTGPLHRLEGVIVCDEIVFDHYTLVFEVGECLIEEIIEAMICQLGNALLDVTSGEIQDAVEDVVQEAILTTSQLANG